MTTDYKVTELFCIIDEFCKHFDAENAGNRLEDNSGVKRRHCQASLSDSEIMTICCIFILVHSAISSTTTCIYTTNWIERLYRKYKRTIRMRTSMPSNNSALFLLASVAIEETKTTYTRKIHQ